MSSMQTSSNIQPNSSAIQTNSLSLGGIQQNLTNQQTFQQEQLIKNEEKSNTVLLVVPPQQQQHQQQSNANPSNSPNSSIAVVAAPRFTQEEKNLLFNLFKQNEDIIDIKYRKNTSKKIISVRECWEKITSDYNLSQIISTKRNTKQIQKFWLNSRLRNHYPNRGEASDFSPKTRNKRFKQQKHQVQIKQATVSEEEQEISSVHNSGARLQNIKFEAVDTNDIETEIEMVDEEEDLQQIEISTSPNDVGLNVEDQPQQYNIDHISAEKLTLSDLLEFKNSRNQREDIVLQIKTAEPQHKDLTSIIPTYTTSYRISNTQPTAVANIPAYISADHTQYQSFQIQPSIQTKPNSSQQPLMITHQHQSPPQQQQQSNCCVHQVQQQPHQSNTPTSTRSNVIDNMEEKINYFKLKEAELRYKEEQLKLEQSKIDLQRSKEELKHMKEIHAFEIEEIKLKIKVLSDEQQHNKTKANEVYKRKN